MIWQTISYIYIYIYITVFRFLSGFIQSEDLVKFYDSWHDPTEWKYNVSVVKRKILICYIDLRLSHIYHNLSRIFHQHWLHRFPKGCIWMMIRISNSCVLCECPISCCSQFHSDDKWQDHMTNAWYQTFSALHTYSSRIISQCSMIWDGLDTLLDSRLRISTKSVII